MEASETLEGQPVYQDSKHEFHAPSARAVRPLLPVTIRVATGESPHYCFPSLGQQERDLGHPREDCMEHTC